MKLFAVGLLLLCASVAVAQPDPRDSIILESKSVLPGGGRPAFTMRVYITNKDSLAYLTLALKEQTLSGNAYALLARPRNFSGVVNRLTNTLPYYPVCSYGCFDYDGMSPDAFLLGSGFDPTLIDPPNGDSVNESIEPPNAVRKAIWEIKFDSVLPGSGTIEFDTARVTSSTGFTNTIPRDIPVNFEKSIITVMPKGDFNLDGALSATDVVEILSAVFSPEAPAAGAYPFDLNCDGQKSPADVIWELYAVFIGRQFPC